MSRNPLSADRGRIRTREQGKLGQLCVRSHWCRWSLPRFLGCSLLYDSCIHPQFTCWRCAEDLAQPSSSCSHRRRPDRLGMSVTQGTSHVPEVMAHLVRVALDDLESADGPEFGVRGGDVVGRLEGCGAPRVCCRDQGDQADDR